jgi:hypothetical protein
MRFASRRSWYGWLILALWSLIGFILILFRVHGVTGSQGGAGRIEGFILTSTIGFISLIAFWRRHPWRRGERHEEERGTR